MDEAEAYTRQLSDTNPFRQQMTEGFVGGAEAMLIRVKLHVGQGSLENLDLVNAGHFNCAEVTCH